MMIQAAVDKMIMMADLGFETSHFSRLKSIFIVIFLVSGRGACYGDKDTIEVIFFWSPFRMTKIVMSIKNWELPDLILS
jgi:hypothetical protein